MRGSGWAGVTVARILRPHGRKGEVAAQILTDSPERLITLREAWLPDPPSSRSEPGLRRAGSPSSRSEPGRPPRRVRIARCRLHKRQAIFQFEGSDSIDDAKRLVGLEVQLPLEHRLPLPAGRYYISDLIGCEVCEKQSTTIPAWRDAPAPPARLGVVRDVQPIGEETPGAPLLVVETGQGELLIPLAEEICTCIDTAARRIEVVLPDGLRELNARG